MRTRKLIKELNKLFKILDFDFGINAGGCCYVASEIAKHLDKLNIEYTLCIVSWDHLDKKIIKENIINRIYGDATGYGVRTHYYLRIGTRGKINTGNFNYDDQFICSIKGLKYEDLKWIYDTGDWNCFYCTDINDYIAEELNKLFKSYENSKNNEMPKM